MTASRNRPGDRRRRPLRFETLEARTLLDGGVADSVVASRGPASAQVSARVTAAETEAHRRYIDSLAQVLTGPIAPGLRSSLVAALDRGRTESFVARRLLREPSVQAGQVAHAYEQLLGRSPLPAELRFHIKGYRRGGDARTAIRSILGTKEYFARKGGTAGGFVAGLYSDVLGRGPSPSEASHWAEFLTRHPGRKPVVSSLLFGRESIDAFVGELGLMAGTVAPGLRDALARDLAKPGGLGPAAARVLGSARFVAMTLSAPAAPVPPRSPLPSPPDIHPPGLPLAPQFDLGTRWTPLASPPFGVLEISSIGAASDGSLWAGSGGPGGSGGSGLSVYSSSTAGWTTVTSSGSIVAVAGVSASLGWAISASPTGGLNTIASYTATGTTTPAPSLPGGDNPMTITAGADGTVWVLGGSGGVYALDAGSASWSTIASDGFTITHISVGSSSNIVAVGKSGSEAVVLLYIAGTGWQVDATFTGTAPTWVGATADGSAWALAGGLIYLRPPGGTWAEVKNQTPPGTILGATAISQYRADFTAIQSPFLFTLTVGVVDQQAVAFPAMNAGQLAGYNAISEAVGAISEGGIRAEYTNSNNQLLFASWFTIVDTMKRPQGVDQADWTSIQAQIKTELLDVQAVYGLFDNMTSLNNEIAIANTNLLTAAATLVGVTVQTQGSDTVALVIEGLIEAALWGIASAGLPVGGAVAASIFASGIGSVISDLTGTPNPNSNTQLDLTYAALAQTLANLYTQTNTTNSTYENAVLSDWGKLNAVGTVVRSGVWAWPVVASSQLAAYANDAYNLYFYQTLMPTKWQIVAFPNYICNSVVCRTITAPSYDQYQVYIVQNQNGSLSNLWFVNGLGAPADPFQQGGAGPFPTQALLSAIFALGVSQNDFFTGQNGWVMKQVTAD